MVNVEIFRFRPFLCAVICLLGTIFSAFSHAKCADMFDHKMRQLHSQNHIDI